MEELDLLKKSWNKTENFPKVSEEKIYGMLKKNSSSLIKWIFIISVLEFIVGIIINIGMLFTKQHDETITMLQDANIYGFYKYGAIAIWVVAIYFIYKFFIAYKKVNTTQSVKSLMESIIKTRNTVKHYIIFNLTAGAIFLLTIYSFVIKQLIDNSSITSQEEITTGIYVGAYVGVVVITLIIIGGLWLFYQLIYGLLLKRLKKNYKELEKIDF